MPQQQNQHQSEADASDQTDNSAEKPTGYDIIKPKVRDIRERIIRELNREGELPVAELRSEKRADVPSGSIEYHLAWLQGRDVSGNPLNWWPDEAGAIIEETGREDLGYANPVRVMGLTDYGKRFAEAFVAETPLSTRKTLSNHTTKLKQHDTIIGQVQTAVDTVKRKNAGLTNTVESLQKDVKALEDDVEDAKTQASKDDIASLRADIERVEKQAEENAENIEEMMGTLEGLFS